MPETVIRTRRRYRLPYFKLRSWLLLSLTVLALATYSISDFWTHYRHRQWAAEINALGATAQFPHPVILTPKASWIVNVWENAKDFYLNPRIVRVVFRQKDSKSLEQTLALVEKLGSVREIASYDAPLTEPQIDHLLRRVQTSALYIQSTKLPRTRIPCLHYQQLQWLSVARTQFSNPAIEDLPDSLTYLDATRTRITDDGLTGLQRLKKLKKLRLHRTPTTNEAVGQLRQKMPWCKIEWEPMSQTHR